MTITDTCKVKTNGLRCPYPQYKNGQCKSHYHKFKHLVYVGKMTWEFLVASGEADSVPQRGNRR
jgi:hypothetical protein